MDNSKLEQDINYRNFSHFNTKGQVLHSFSNSKSRLGTGIMEVSSEIYKHIRENNNRIFVGYQNCRIYDLINIKPCFKCGRYGHNGLECRNKISCVIKKNLRVLTVCTNILKYKSKYDTSHSAMETNKGKIYRNKIKRLSEMTDYPMKAIIPITIPTTTNISEKARTQELRQMSYAN